MNHLNLKNIYNLRWNKTQKYMYTGFPPAENQTSLQTCYLLDPEWLLLMASCLLTTTQKDKKEVGFFSLCASLLISIRKINKEIKLS